MIDEKWEQFVELAKEKFEDVSLTQESLPDEQEGIADILEFTAPHGRFQMIRQTRPKVIEKKQHYATRATDTATTEYVFSDSEVTHKLMVKKEDDEGEWEEVKASDLGLQ